MRSQTMNSETTASFLTQLSEQHPDVPILLLWDRAKWHGGQAVRDFLAAHPRFEVMKFPAGSPDLNPQEHVWKLTRERMSHNHLKTQMPELADVFESYLLGSVFKSTFLDNYGYSAVCPMFK